MVDNLFKFFFDNSIDQAWIQQKYLVVEGSFAANLVRAVESHIYTVRPLLSEVLGTPNLYEVQKDLYHPHLYYPRFLIPKFSTPKYHG